MNIDPTRCSSHETWLVASWLFCDEVEFNKWAEIADQLVHADVLIKSEIKEASAFMPEEILANKLRDSCIKRVDEKIRNAGLIDDLVNHALSRVAWQEVARLVIEQCSVTDDA